MTSNDLKRAQTKSKEPDIKKSKLVVGILKLTMNNWMKFFITKIFKWKKQRKLSLTIKQ